MPDKREQQTQEHFGKKKRVAQATLSLAKKFAFA